MARNPIRAALAFAAKSKPAVEGMTNEQLEWAISSISVDLLGHGIGQRERIVLHEDRKVYRAELARRRAALETSHD